MSGFALYRRDVRLQAARAAAAATPGRVAIAPPASRPASSDPASELELGGSGSDYGLSVAIGPPEPSMSIPSWSSEFSRGVDPYPDPGPGSPLELALQSPDPGAAEALAGEISRACSLSRDGAGDGARSADPDASSEGGADAELEGRRHSASPGLLALLRSSSPPEISDPDRPRDRPRDDPTSPAASSFHRSAWS
eukprot:tig00000640_g2764.t1